MPLELDHLFIFTGVGAPELETLLALGLVEGSPNTHPGQGTACRRLFFHNAYLEFLWVRDEAETRHELIRPMGFAGRWRYRQTGYSPLGLCLRRSDPAGPLPFATWAYRPPYVPAGVWIDVADNSNLTAEPLLFSIPFGGRPDGYPAGRRQPLDHPLGGREITGLTVNLPPARPLSPALQAVELAGLVGLKPGQAHGVEVVLDGGGRGRLFDFRPGLPLVLRW